GRPRLRFHRFSGGFVKQRQFLTGALLLAPLLAGCHTFTPVERSQLQPGQSVRVTLTPAESVNHVQLLGSLKESVQGTVREVEASNLGLTLATAPPPVPGSPANTGLRSYLELPWSGVSGVEVKRMNWLRTGLLAAGAAVVTVVILDVADLSGGSNNEGGVNEQRVRIPLLTLSR
ncbi:MAG TPA: hypothetical protein VLA43_13245, partial [Longimicrobiales bacterium]|nr:hypothetical protein [Longimicrobiales bacterium]